MSRKMEPSELGVAQEKVWGWMRPLYLNERIRVVEAFACQDGYCSLHQHLFQSNVFIVSEGRLRIYIYDGTSTRHTETVTLDRNRTVHTVLPSVRHRFEALQDTNFHEVYVGFYNSAPDENDIVREDHGNIRTVKPFI